ncbi:MAG: hypothetical protein JOZ34_10575, partial [Gammaproteobacteria bacterium]|nr:hypothetical protein [Gammaproteobacteria bacterium]
MRNSAAQSTRHIAFALLALALSGLARAEPAASSWLDAASLESWNHPGLSLPAAPQRAKNLDPRCRQLARSPVSDEDRQLQTQGWDLMGTPTQGAGMRVIGAASDYDGMCRPRQ